MDTTYPDFLPSFHRGVVCVDLDGTLTGFTESLDTVGPALPGAQEALRELRELGYRIVIHTARPGDARQETLIRERLEAEGIPFDGIHADPGREWDSPKPLADLYIDDRALRFRGDWAETLREAREILGYGEWGNGTRTGNLPGTGGSTKTSRSAHASTSTSTSMSTSTNYGDLLERVLERAGAVRLFEAFLRGETAWATAPASTRFHLARPGGLVAHSVNVARTLLRLRAALAPELSEESCVIVALYHDVGKAGTAGRPYYLPNPDAWQVRNRGVRYVVNRDLPHMDIASRSLMLVSRFVPLSDEEAQAIRYHDGQYIEENRSVAHREAKLTRLLQYADNWSGGVLEAETG